MGWWHSTGYTLNQIASLALKYLKSNKEAKGHKYTSDFRLSVGHRRMSLLFGHNEGGDVYLRS